MALTKINFAATITALVIATAAITIAFPSVTVLATPLLGQAAAGNNNATTSAPMSTTGGGQQSTIQIVKDGTNTYVIAGSSSSVGSFDTTYRIAGERTAIRTAENLIVSTVVDDFKKSPTIGYVRIANMTTTTTTSTTSTSTTTGNASTTTTANPTLPNPFATPEQVTERITNEIRRVISEAENNTSQGQYVEINCGFGMSLEDMRCHYVPLPQAGQG